MIKPAVEEILELLYIHEAEGGPYPDEALDPYVLADAEADKLVVQREDRWHLSKEGHTAGRSVVRRHRLAERLLTDVLSAGSDRLEEDACRFEHILNNELDDKICTLLGHPTTCPHGQPIPPGECCTRANNKHVREVGPLCDGRPGDEGTVAYLTTRDNHEVQKLMAMGILPGAKIKLLWRFPSYVFQVGFSQFTVDRELAEFVYVHWKGKETP